MQQANFEEANWRLEAECIGSPKLFFDPEFENKKHRTIRETKALAICGACDVRNECLNEAIENGESGIWGGTLENERINMRRRRRNASALNSSTFVNIGNTALRITEI